MTNEQKLREALVEAEQFIHFYKDLIKKHAIDGIHRIEPIHQNVKEALSIPPPTPVDEGNEEIARLAVGSWSSLSDGDLISLIRIITSLLSAKDDEKAVLTEKNKRLVEALKKAQDHLFHEYSIDGKRICNKSLCRACIAQQALQQFGGWR